jgi:uncharacterized protein YjbI with pentapeptide repeats
LISRWVSLTVICQLESKDRIKQKLSDYKAKVIKLINLSSRFTPYYLKFLSLADLSGEDLIRVDLSNANLSCADLSNANLTEADLSNANLARAILFYANLSGANLQKADLFEVNLFQSNLTNQFIFCKP